MNKSQQIYVSYHDETLNLIMSMKTTSEIIWTYAETTLQKKLKTTPERIACLMVCRKLKENNELVISAQIARILNKQSQSIVGVLNRLEREGYVTRISKRKGQPYTIINITERGSTLLDNAINVIQQMHNELSSTIELIYPAIHPKIQNNVVNNIIRPIGIKIAQELLHNEIIEIKKVVIK